MGADGCVVWVCAVGCVVDRVLVGGGHKLFTSLPDCASILLYETDEGTWSVRPPGQPSDRRRV